MSVGHKEQAGIADRLARFAMNDEALAKAEAGLMLPISGDAGPRVLQCRIRATGNVFHHRRI